MKYQCGCEIIPYVTYQTDPDLEGYDPREIDVNVNFCDKRRTESIEKAKEQLEEDF